MGDIEPAPHARGAAGADRALQPGRLVQGLRHQIAGATGLAYRVAYTSDTTGGLKLAVTSGLAIAPISRSNIPADCRELTLADGFGHVDSSNVVMHRNPNAFGEAIDGMEEAIREAFVNRQD